MEYSGEPSHSFVGNHECRVEAQAEVADDVGGGVLILVEEFLGARECDLVDILVYILGSHAYARVADSERAGLLVDGHAHVEGAKLALELAKRGEGA